MCTGDKSSSKLGCRLTAQVTPGNNMPECTAADTATTTTTPQTETEPIQTEVSAAVSLPTIATAESLRYTLRNVGDNDMLTDYVRVMSQDIDIICSIVGSSICLRTDLLPAICLKTSHALTNFYGLCGVKGQYVELSKYLHSTQGNIGLTVGKKRAVQVNENVCAQSHALNTVNSHDIAPSLRCSSCPSPLSGV